MEFVFKRLTLTILFFCLYVIVVAQSLEKDANANFKDFFLLLALDQYIDLYEKDSTNLEYCYRIGFCYLNMEVDRSKALPYIKKAFEKGYQKSDILLDIGIAYFYNTEFEKSIKILEKFRLKEKNKELIAIANDYINYAINAKDLMRKPLNVSFNNLGKSINSEQSDYNPFLNSDDNILFFTTDRKYNSMFKTNIQNVYFSSFDGKKWKKCKSAGNKINTNEDEILTGISSNNKSLFVQLKRFDIYNDTYRVVADGSRIKEMYPLGENINNKSIESGATLSSKGDTLFFASDRPGGYGGLDIYMAFRLPDGTWGDPENLGNEINTEMDEDFPYLADNGQTIYFASKGHNSMGGFDLYKTELVKSTNRWNKPRNLGYPINTIYDDNTISFSNDGRYAYKAAIMSIGFGGYDIYQIVFNDKEKVYTVYKGNVNIAGKDSTYNILHYNNSLQLKIYISNTNNLFGKYSIDKETGSYLIALPPGRYYASLSDEKFKENQVKFEVPEMNSNRIVIRRNISFTFKEE